jgi:hypothetical protein
MRRRVRDDKAVFVASAAVPERIRVRTVPARTTGRMKDKDMMPPGEE